LVLVAVLVAMFVFPGFEICVLGWRYCKHVGSLGKSVGWFDKP